MTTITLIGDSQRAYAKQCIDNAPNKAIVSIKPSTRSLEQNAKLWAMLGEVAKAKPEGRSWQADVWKAAFMHSLGWQVQFCEGLNGNGPFPIGFRSSHLTIPQMADLIEIIYEYGARNGVVFHEPKEKDTV